MKMIKYIIYTQKNCIYCAEAKSLLDEAGETYEERELDTAEKVRRFKKAGHKTVPQIFLHIGGFHELEEFFFGDDVGFKPDIKLVEKTKPTGKVIPFKGKIGAISGDKDE
jgi:glutaredoxin